MRAILSLTLAALALQGLTHAARAALGGGADSVETDRVSMGALNHLTQGSALQTHVLQLPSGTVVTEYVSAGGKVYAVSWTGPSLPDLHQILGTYFAHYQAAAKEPIVRHRVVRLETSDIVIESAGKMRAFTGRAWVPALLPSGVTAADIK